MTTRSLAVRVGQVTAAAVAAGTVGSAALLVSEALLARNRRYAQPELGLAVRAALGPAGGEPLRLVLLGDSVTLGVGVSRVADTVGGQLARLLTQHDGDPAAGRRRVLLSSVGVAGSRSSDLSTQVARALLGQRPDVAVILIGINDATSLRRPGESAVHLAAAVRRLRGAGAEVVVGTCPDLGAARAIAPPLRQVAGLLGRRTARAQARAARDAGARVVDLANETGAVFRADPGTYCHDGYHPSADGYRIWAHALLPAVRGAATAASRS
ncbi:MULTISPECIES: SGNH/GDSL hydrolase family protein [unclassified Solwaraspora]|uniref:SGNH/GDSL hydrolase family protein n=1 Tax=unclassified Solwaraspora TaxID=2627926 RepID=UPI00259BD3D8|nr:SGNH/GDSL hydrolase family protein [Solwaraspora sp. WMMA2056]WJK42447.1 SGNH/GDSL hydrolase family protein [Solwaraspora sp. WMMA2056]